MSGQRHRCRSVTQSEGAAATSMYVTIKALHGPYVFLPGSKPFHDKDKKKMVATFRMSYIANVSVRRRSKKKDLFDMALPAVGLVGPLIFPGPARGRLNPPLNHEFCIILLADIDIFRFLTGKYQINKLYAVECIHVN